PNLITCVLLLMMWSVSNRPSTNASVAVSAPAHVTRNGAAPRFACVLPIQSPTSPLPAHELSPPALPPEPICTRATLEAPLVSVRLVAVSADALSDQPPIVPFDDVRVVADTVPVKLPDVAVTV